MPLPEYPVIQTSRHSETQQLRPTLLSPRYELRLLPIFRLRLTIYRQGYPRPGSHLGIQGHLCRPLLFLPDAGGGGCSVGGCTGHLPTFFFICIFPQDISLFLAVSEIFYHYILQIFGISKASDIHERIVL